MAISFFFFFLFVHFCSVSFGFYNAQVLFSQPKGEKCVQINMKWQWMDKVKRQRNGFCVKNGVSCILFLSLSLFSTSCYLVAVVAKKKRVRGVSLTVWISFKANKLLAVIA